eukprot:14723020-Ditylum_brightwellii.AAC.1
MMHHLKDRLQEVDRQYMFQNLQESGIQDSQKQAIQGVKPITSYFKKKTSISRSYLPPRFASHYDGLKCDAKQRHRKHIKFGKVPGLYGDGCLDCGSTYLMG